MAAREGFTMINAESGTANKAEYPKLKFTTRSLRAALGS
jgi:hypothetical protein